MARPDWDDYFLQIAHLLAERSTCLRRKVGALLVMDRRILTTGYNGAPSGLEHCEEVGCLREAQKIPSGQRHELCRGIHAEQNAIIQAAQFGVIVKSATLYCTHQPCILCAKMLINVDLRRLVIASGYPDAMAEDFLQKGGVEIIRKEKCLKDD